MEEGESVMEEGVFEDRGKKSEVGSQKYKYKIQGAGTQH